MEGLGVTTDGYNYKIRPSFLKVPACKSLVSLCKSAVSSVLLLFFWGVFGRGERDSFGNDSTGCVQRLMLSGTGWTSQAAV